MRRRREAARLPLQRDGQQRESGWSRQESGEVSPATSHLPSERWRAIADRAAPEGGHLRDTPTWDQAAPSLVPARRPRDGSSLTIPASCKTALFRHSSRHTRIV